LRKPSVVSVVQKDVTMIRTRGKKKPTTIQRWYVTLSFGGEKKKLAISSSAARWLMGSDV
jgi:hypothetical protein